jgi:hypothetical protein
MSGQAKEYEICKKAGFPSQMISFEKNGVKPDGSVKWKVLNADGSEHQHKGSTAKQSNNAEIVTALNRIAVALETIARVKCQ